MNTAPIYLDCNATTPVDPRVLEAEAEIDSAAAAVIGAWQSLTT
jgi:cysteine sulfinate desulfinase/cysteine desulfurase-like protein